MLEEYLYPTQKTTKSVRKDVSSPSEQELIVQTAPSDAGNTCDENTMRRKKSEDAKSSLDACELTNQKKTSPNANRRSVQVLPTHKIQSEKFSSSLIGKIVKDLRR